MGDDLGLQPIDEVVDLDVALDLAAAGVHADGAVVDVAVTDEKMTLSKTDLTPEGVVKLSMGRKRHVLLKPV